MKTVRWTVRIKNAPTAVRYCKRCGARTEFIPSERFRVNAQRKSLDVWLVYRCSVCDTTWSLTVLSRVSPRAISAELLRGFSQNDPDLARRYANDIALIRRSGAAPGPPEIEITGTDIARGESARIQLFSPQPLALRAAVILRKRLGLSYSELDKLIASGKLVCTSGHDIRKRGLSGEMVFEIRQD